MALVFDSLTPTCCIGPRKLRTAYAGQCLRLTVGGGTDFGFVGNDFDRTAMEAAVGAGAGGTVNIWYDQSGNTRNVTSAGSVSAVRTAGVTNLVGGKVASLCTVGQAGIGAVTYATLGSNNAMTILWAGMLTVVATNNAADPSQNVLIHGSAGSYFGVGFRTTGQAEAYNFNAAYQKAATPYSLSIPLAVAWRHSGGNVQINVNGSGWVSTTSGNTDALTDLFQIGGVGGTVYHGEMATFATALSDANVALWGQEALSYRGSNWAGMGGDWTSPDRTPDRTPDSTPQDRLRLLRRRY